MKRVHSIEIFLLPVLQKMDKDYLFAPEEDHFLSKALVFQRFLVFRRIGEYISLDLLYMRFLKPLFERPFKSSGGRLNLHVTKTRITVQTGSCQAE